MSQCKIVLGNRNKLAVKFADDTHSFAACLPPSGATRSSVLAGGSDTVTLVSLSVLTGAAVHRSPLRLPFNVSWE